jgi:multidrug efflux pump subunit AcrB
MKKSIRNALLGLVGTSLGMYMMVAPLTATVSANASVQNTPIQNQNQNQKHDKFSKEEMAQYIKLCRAHHQHDKNNKQTPVEVVQSDASELGFDTNNDTFTLVSENQNTSVVQVLHDGNDYNVTLVRSDNGQWLVSSMD